MFIQFDGEIFTFTSGTSSPTHTFIIINYGAIYSLAVVLVQREERTTERASAFERVWAEKNVKSCDTNFKIFVQNKHYQQSQRNQWHRKCSGI